MFATNLIIDSSIFCVWGLLSFVDIVVVYLCEPIFKLGGKVLRIHLRENVKPTPRVVVLGSSFAGLAVRSALGPSFEVVLVDRKVSPSCSLDGMFPFELHRSILTTSYLKAYFEYTPGILRCLVDPAHARNLCCPIPAPSNGQVLTGEVVGLSAHSALVKVDGKDTQELSFDYCVVALGSAYR
jgi:hypothetical protein